jgi:hypothetical protein
MATAYGGKAVYGGTYPAIIFKDFMEKALGTLTTEAYDRAHHISQTSLIAQTAPNGAVIPQSSLPSYSDGPTSSTPTSTTTPSTTTAPTAGGTTTTTPANNPPTPRTPSTPTPTGPGGGASAP